MKAALRIIGIVAACIGIIVSATMIHTGNTMIRDSRNITLPDKHIFVYGTYSSFEPDWSDNMGESYVGGDAYNYIIEASLKAGYYNAAATIKAEKDIGGKILVSVSTFFLFVSVFFLVLSAWSLEKCLSGARREKKDAEGNTNFRNFVLSHLYHIREHLTAESNAFRHDPPEEQAKIGSCPADTGPAVPEAAAEEPAETGAAPIEEAAAAAETGESEAEPVETDPPEETGPVPETETETLEAEDEAPEETGPAPETEIETPEAEDEAPEPAEEPAEPILIRQTEKKEDPVPAWLAEINRKHNGIRNDLEKQLNESIEATKALVQQELQGPAGSRKAREAAAIARREAQERQDELRKKLADEDARYREELEIKKQES